MWRFTPPGVSLRTTTFLLYFGEFGRRWLGRPAEILQGPPFMLSKIRSASKGFVFPSWSIPIALLGFTLLSYGLRARSLGFYWDDWPYLWFFDRFGPQGIVTAFTDDRPFLSFIYTLSLTILGNSSQAWQAFALLARWLCGVGLWWALAQAWPRHAHKAAWAAILFTLYPGFTQHWIAVIYGQAFFLFALIFFSTGLTLWMAQRRRLLKPAWMVAGTLLALALSAFTMFSTEYFFGVEMLRLMLLWVVFRGEGSLTARRTELLRRARQTALWWAPYLGLMLFFVLWRMYLHPFSGYQLTTLQSAEASPLNTLVQLSLTIVHDLSVASLTAWGQTAQVLSGFLDRPRGSILRLLVVIFFSGALAALYFARLRPRGTGSAPETDCPEQSWALQAVVIGVLAALAAGWPTWITSLPMRMGFPLDRYALAISVGISLALAGLIDAFGRDLLRKAIVLALAVALATGFHFETALRYDQDWNTASSFFWQLTWRAPAVQPNTLFASVDMPFQYFEDDSLTAPLNWTYDPDGKSKQMRYILYDLNVRKNSLPAIQFDQPVEKAFRGAQFSGNISQMVLFSYEPPGCVHILDPQYDTGLYRLPDRLLQVLPFSSPSAVIQDAVSPAAPPAEIFGSEPRHRWCYYYQKAELARQSQDWAAIYDLGDDAIDEGYRPEDAVEYLPFIEGYARFGQMDDAYELSVTAINEAPDIRPALCAIWQRALDEAPDAPDRHRARANRSFHCSIP